MEKNGPVKYYDPLKRYNLILPGDHPKPKAQLKKCPECKSDNLKTRSRRRYFFKSAVCAVIVLPYWYSVLWMSLHEEDMPDPPFGIMVLVLLVLSCLVAVDGLYCFIRAILTRRTSYRCRYCQAIFTSPISPVVVN
jgi:hypothetical protein